MRNQTEITRAKGLQGQEIKKGDEVGFKYDLEGKGKVLAIVTERDFVGTLHTRIIIEVLDGHHGYEYYSHQYKTNVIEVAPRNVWQLS